MNPPEDIARLRVVFAHDWLTGMRGGERVLELLCQAFPGAPILTLIHNRKAVSPVINAHPVRTSWLQRIPGIFRNYRRFLPLFPAAARGLRPPPCDLLISTSHCVAKSIAAPRGARHLCVCFTPMRYVWAFQDEYVGRNPLVRAAAAPVLGALRRWDRRTASRVDRFAAISAAVRDRIRLFYGREADVVYPPVDTRRWTPGPGMPGDYDLIVSALVPYKRIDLAIRASAISGRALRIVGIGGELERLRRIAAPTVEFLGWQPDERVLELYRGCRLLLFPGEEDFGLVPLEAQACGRPVVAFGRGGALETVLDGETGVFFAEPSVESLQGAIDRAGRIDWDPARIRAHAETFGIDRFWRGLAESIRRCHAAEPFA